MFRETDFATFSTINNEKYSFDSHASDAKDALDQS